MSEARAIDLIYEGLEPSLQKYYKSNIVDGRKILGGGNLQDRNRDHQVVYGSCSTRVGEDKLVNGYLHVKRKWRGKYYFYKVTVQEIKEEDEGHGRKSNRAT